MLVIGQGKNISLYVQWFDRDGDCLCVCVGGGGVLMYRQINDFVVVVGLSICKSLLCYKTCF